MRPFVHTQLAARVVFGPGRLAELPEEVDRLGARRTMLIAGRPERHLLERAAELLGDRVVTIWDDVRQHVPQDFAERAAAHAIEHEADLIVTIGGGSTTGLGKAIVRRHPVPILAVPTTYAGSEMTPIWGETTKGDKRTGRDEAVLPKAVIYDPQLTLTLPPALSGASGMNAMAHCVEAVYAPGASPVTTTYALMAIGSLAEGLPRVVRNPEDVTARGDVQFGAFLAGAVLATAGISIHHHVCHVLGGMFDLPHAELHTVMLPQAVAAVAKAVPEQVAEIAGALGAEQAPAGLYDLAKGMGLPVALSQIGLGEAEIDQAVPRCVEATRGDVLPLDDAGARALLTAAVRGQRP